MSHLILISILALTACKSDLPTTKTTTTPYNEIDTCTKQEALVLVAYRWKHNNIAEQSMLDGLEQLEQPPTPQWLYVRYQQIIRDVYRRPRNPIHFSRDIYKECRAFKLYPAKEQLEKYKEKEHAVSACTEIGC